MAIDYNKRPTPAPAPTAQPAGSPVSLSKITLTKSAPSVSLSKQGSAEGILRVNLNWNARPAAAAAPSGGKGFLKRLSGAAAGGGGAIDLDLGCLYEFSDGTKGVVQALGNAFTATPRGSSKPAIWLDGDDRSGSVAGGENLLVDLGQRQALKRVLVFAFIYEGVPNWAAAEAVVTLHPVAGPQVEMALDEADQGSPLCAIALLENVGGDIQVRREVQYIRGAQDVLDQRYDWGMNWKAGRK